MKTIIIYEQFITPVRFLVVEGDYSKFGNIYINGDNCDETLMYELNEFMYNTDGRLKYELLKQFPTEVVQSTKDVKVIVAGFFP